MELYVDMDGVLADFDGHFRDFYKGDSYDYSDKFGLDSMWEFINDNDPHFFLNLKWMPGGEELWKFVRLYNPTILSTPAYTVKACREDKRKWIRSHLGPAVHYIFSNKKAKYATPSSILIDDMEKNIRPWREAGGVGILHNSAEETISILKKLLP